MADEVLMARQYTRRMHQAREIGVKRIDKRTPGGRFNPRAHMRAHAQRTLGVPVSSHPWEITKIVTARDLACNGSATSCGAGRGARDR